MTPVEVIDRIDRLFAERGCSEYHGEPVTQLEHALQCAALAEGDGEPAEVIAAALLHDVGHLLSAHGEDALERGVDDRHEELAARFLSRAFGPAVTEPIRLHVPAKRFLCTTRAGYFDALSTASGRSLELQGGPMTASEVAAFAAGEHFRTAVKVREYDDRAKVVGCVTPTFAHFRTYLERCMV